MPSLLGKRSRSTGVEEDAIVTRSKRRVGLSKINDENQNPFAPSHVEHEADQRDRMDVDAFTPARQNAARHNLPAKHGAPGRRISVSPAKISQHFPLAKSMVDVYQDRKNDTPKTPRHRDALSKKVPITPRHRVLASQATPGTPRTPVTPSNAVTVVYNQARQVFSRCSSPGRLVGRDIERQELSKFIRPHLDSKTGGCLYVSGPPGTGKSALVNEVCEEINDVAGLRLSFVNCMTVRSTTDLAEKICDDLKLSNDDTALENLRSTFLQGKMRNSPSYLLVLDEVDRLVDLDLALLYQLFEWSMEDTSRLTLIGIANALDLTDRFLPRLKSRNLKPELLPFLPYTAGQISDVLTARLRGLCSNDQQELPFLHHAAVQFCAKKVAAQTGDLRKAFDICRRAIDLVDQETRAKDAPALQDSPSKTPLMENINLSSPSTPRSPDKKQAKRPSQPAYTTATAPKVTIAHMAKVTAQVFGNGTTQRLSSLNLQQKAVLCALSALEKRNRSASLFERNVLATPSKRRHATTTAPTIKQLYEAYTTLCTREKLLHPLSSIEFRDVVSGLESLGLVSAVDGTHAGDFVLPITPSKTPSRRGKAGFGRAAATGDGRKVASVAEHKELSAALEGPGGGLLREIMDGEVWL